MFLHFYGSLSKVHNYSLRFIFIFALDENVCRQHIFGTHSTDSIVHFLFS